MNREKFESAVVSLPLCGICDSPLVVKVDDRYSNRVWLTCLECKKAIDRNGELESLNNELQEKWLKAESLYNQLQDHIKCLIS